MESELQVVNDLQGVGNGGTARIDINGYLRRLGAPSIGPPALQTLRRLHRAHLLAVPFENLDIHLGRPILLDEQQLYEKIVLRRRGGICYELNGLFAALLRALGFDVLLISARVASSQNGYGIEFDHMALIVRLEADWLVDVGFGDAFIEPLRLAARDEQVQERERFRIEEVDGGLLYLRHDQSAWQPQYHFTLQAHTLADFAGGCHYHQTSPVSRFTRGRVCSRATPRGRVTVNGERLIETADGKRMERLLTDEDEVSHVLRQYFGVIC